MSAVRDFPVPKSHHKLREFLGLVNYYHRFIPHCAQVLHPLHTLLSNTPTNSNLQWSGDCLTAFNQIKTALADATLLFHTKPDAVVAIMSDASDIAVGAVLQQFVDSQWQPIAYYSHRLSVDIAPTIENFLLFICQLNNLDTLWKVVFSLFILTTNLSHFPCILNLKGLLLDRLVTWISLPSSPRTFTILKGVITP